MKKFILLILTMGITMNLFAQADPLHHERQEEYIGPTEPEIIKKLEQWQDMKFGLMLTWGPYSQWGIVEGWSICNEDWIHRRNGRYENYDLYKIDYTNLKHTFNPEKFNPGKWVQAAKAAGMKYVVGMAKHHDGFCMFETKTTEYKITDKDCPFSKNPRANILKEILSAFRDEGFWSGVYFSKPDWSTEYYWWPYYATPDRHVNYDPAKHPQRWQNFKDYTYNQIEELMTNFGEVDLLWLDGAWVRPIENMPEKFKDWALKKNWNQDIDMARIGKMARKYQPDLLIVDRWVKSEYENYLTPENRVPEHMIPYPWESCITSTPGWSYSPNAKFKSTQQLIEILVNVVSKGGNLLLNIGPSPDGTWPADAYDRLEKIGEWMKVNGEAIYETRAIAPYESGNIYFINKKDSNLVYAIYLPDKDEQTLPSTIRINNIQPKENAEIFMLGVNDKLIWKKTVNGFVVNIPESVRKNPPCKYAWTIKFSIDK